MKLSNYIVISAIFHSIVMLIFWSPIEKKIESPAAKTLVVSFVKQGETDKNTNINQYTEVIDQLINEITNVTSTVSQAEMESSFEQIATDANETSIEPDLSRVKYYSINEVDIKALPVSNIDISMVSDIERSGLPIKLRIYINVFGKIDKIERLSNALQDEEFLNRIEFLLKETAFLPAKKNGVNVDFVQEIELSI